MIKHLKCKKIPTVIQEGNTISKHILLNLGITFSEHELERLIDIKSKQKERKVAKWNDCFDRMERENNFFVSI